jgi:Protein-tyrosine-phosphatase
MTLRVLMVCTGNICRSTMAQEVLAEQVGDAGLDVSVDSAGISDEEHGNPIDPRAARVLREAGHRVPDHQARQVRADELGSWDLVLAMTRQHLAALERLVRRAGVEEEADPAPGDHHAVDLRMYRSFDPALWGPDPVPPAGGLSSLRREGARTGPGAPREAGGSGVRVGDGGDRPDHGGSGGGRGSVGPSPDVPDPWYGGHEDFVETLDVIERVTPALVDHLRGILDGSRP